MQIVTPQLKVVRQIIQSLEYKSVIILIKFFSGYSEWHQNLDDYTPKASSPASREVRQPLEFLYKIITHTGTMQESETSIRC